MKLSFTTRAFAAAALLTAGSARAEPVQIQNLDLFVDPPSAFVFIRMPQGWKFVGKLDEVGMRSLPAGVHTKLLPDDAGEVLSSLSELEQSR